MNCFNVNTIGIPNVRTASWDLQYIKDLKMTEWSVETCSPIISGNKCCADVNNWLIIVQNSSYLRQAVFRFSFFGASFNSSILIIASSTFTVF